jgi:hypothetical protein
MEDGSKEAENERLVFGDLGTKRVDFNNIEVIKNHVHRIVHVGHNMQPQLLHADAARSKMYCTRMMAPGDKSLIHCLPMERIGMHAGCSYMRPLFARAMEHDEHPGRARHMRRSINYIERDVRLHFA